MVWAELRGEKITSAAATRPKRTQFLLQRLCLCWFICFSFRHPLYSARNYSLGISIRSISLNIMRRPHVLSLLGCIPCQVCSRSNGMRAKSLRSTNRNFQLNLRIPCSQRLSHRTRFSCRHWRCAGSRLKRDENRSRIIVPNPTPLRQPVAPYNRNCGLAFGKRTASSMFLNRWRAEISGSWPNQADCGIQLWFPCG